MAYKALEFGNRVFKTLEERNDALFYNANKIMELKREAVHKASEKGQYASLSQLKQSATKGPFDMEQGYVYPVINTSNWLDSHGDVHFPKLWDDTLTIMQKAVAYVADHEMSIDNLIVPPTFVNAFAKMIPWIALGEQHPGETYALVYEFKKSDMMHPKAIDLLNKNIPMQNSIRMSYGEMFLAINDNRAELMENKKLFDYHINSIVNKSLALESGYFWGIIKADIILEGSMVMRGSNKVTPILMPDTEIIGYNKAELITTHELITQKTMCIDRYILDNF